MSELESLRSFPNYHEKLSIQPGFNCPGGAMYSYSFNMETAGFTGGSINLVFDVLANDLDKHPEYSVIMGATPKLKCSATDGCVKVEKEWLQEVYCVGTPNECLSVMHDLLDERPGLEGQRMTMKFSGGSISWQCAGSNASNLIELPSYHSISE